MITQNALQVLDRQFIERKADFVAMLPSSCSFERFSRIVKTAVIRSPDLLEADRASLLLSSLEAAYDGLLPDGREAALTVYRTKQKDGSYKRLVQYMPMVAGVLKKVRNSGELVSLSAHVAYENDEFDYRLGDDERIIHKPCLGDRGNPVCAYVIVKTKDHGIYREVMSVAEIEKNRGISKAKDSQAWKEHWAEMAKKTVIHRVSKRLPSSSDLEVFIRRDDEMLNFKRHNVTSISNPITHNINANNKVIDITSSNVSTQIETSEDGEVLAEEVSLDPLNNVESVVLINKASPVEKGTNNDTTN